MNLYKMSFHTSLIVLNEPRQFGDVESVIHSDTLYSAIWSLWNWLFPGDKIFLEDEIVNNFILSSAFPYYQNKYFFPKPQSYFFKHNVHSSDQRKSEKKIQFVEKAIFEKVLNGVKRDLSEIIIHQKAFAITDKVNKKFFERRTIEKNSLSRFTDASTKIFYETELEFNKDAGLFFFAEFKDESIKKKFESVLSLFGDEGIGLNRTTGHGAFRITADEIELNLPNSNEYLVLSSYLPSKEDMGIINFEDSTYELYKRGGWITNYSERNNIKKSVNMFKEGSVINSKGKLTGRICNLKPDGCKINIWRSGLFFGLPIIREV